MNSFRKYCGRNAIKNDGRTFSSSLYSFKLNLIPHKSLRVAFCNKISFSWYSSNIDPQTSKQMFMDDMIFTPIFSKLSWKVVKMHLQIMLQNDVLLQKWFILQNSNCNTKTVFCNKFLVSQYSIFFHSTSLRFE